MGWYSNIKERCYICEVGYKVFECFILLDLIVDECFELVRKFRLCFLCFGKGYLIRECKIKKRCGCNGCYCYYYFLLYNDLFLVIGVFLILDWNGILFLVRVWFWVLNGWVREGNVLIDSGVVIIVIRKDFVKVFGL